jgi:RNA polymerase sigma factor (sigma-70 family)
VTEEEALAAQFEAQRAYLHAIAFRMLGSHADADDAVQEAWLRLARTGGGGIEDLRGWLTTVTSRICLDALRRRGVRGEQPLELDVGTLPREAVGGSRIDPEEEAMLAESVGLALYVVMDALTPAESRPSSLLPAQTVALHPVRILRASRLSAAQKLPVPYWGRRQPDSQQVQNVRDRTVAPHPPDCGLQPSGGRRRPPLSRGGWVGGWPPKRRFYVYS